MRRRTRVLLMLGAVLLIVSSVPAVPAATRSGLSSPNVEWLGTLPFEAGTWSTARVYGEYLYAAGNKSFSIYDISTPETPTLVSLTPTGFQFINEDIDTNGEILLITDERVRGVLQVWDVSDKTTPVKLAELEEMIDHSFECVYGCRWAYGAGGDIVDLRDPANPKAAGRWVEYAPPLWGFDTEEVRPGMVVTASGIIHLLDGRKNPAKPKVVAAAPGPANRFVHSIQWPSNGKDRFLLVQTETSPKPQCDANSGALMTWDATKWRKKHTFYPLHEYRVPAGVYADGNPPASALGCSATWFKPHPRFHNGGLIAGAFFDHGTRFLEVLPNGAIVEAGYFMPLAGSTTAALWANDEIVYAIDIAHGMDILRYTGDV